MKITAIEAQVKNADRVSIYVDGAYAFSLNQNQLLEQKIHSGLELDNSRLVELKKASELGKAYARLLNYVTIRPRSLQEVKHYAKRKHMAPGDSQAIIDRLIARNYINDNAFARSWVESRRLTKPTSLRRLRLELRQKGVEAMVITDSLEESAINEAETLRAVISKKRRQSRYQDDKKLTQYLLRQGFLFSDIITQLEKY